MGQGHPSYFWIHQTLLCRKYEFGYFSTLSYLASFAASFITIATYIDLHVFVFFFPSKIVFFFNILLKLLWIITAGTLKRRTLQKDIQANKVSSSLYYSRKVQLPNMIIGLCRVCGY